jgi:uncharacterized membrane protein (TIGR02234 family)
MTCWRPTVGEGSRDRRRTFGPVVLLGLATSALAAVASAKPWMDSTSARGDGDTAMAAVETGTSYPVASATSLVLLAAWGVLLVTRGVVRRVFALVALVAALALVVAVVAGYLTLPETARDSYDELMGRGTRDPGYTGWFWTAAFAAVVAVVPAVLATRLVRDWPEMGSRYDAPGSSRQSGTVAEPDRDLWTALDEGRDPTDTRPQDGASPSRPSH